MTVRVTWPEQPICRFVLALGLALATANSCSPSSHPTGLVNGELEVGGGPPPGNPHPVAGEVVFITNSNHATYRVTADTSGRFTVRLPAGTYTVVGTPDGTNWTCSGAVKVMTNQDTELPVACSVA